MKVHQHAALLAYQFKGAQIHPLSPMNYFCDSETEAITQIAFNSDSACKAINNLISPTVNSLHRYEVTTAATVARPSRENSATHESILRNITSRN